MESSVASGAAYTPDTSLASTRRNSAIHSETAPQHYYDQQQQQQLQDDQVCYDAAVNTPQDITNDSLSSAIVDASTDALLESTTTPVKRASTAAGHHQAHTPLESKCQTRPEVLCAPGPAAATTVALGCRWPEKNVPRPHQNNSSRSTCTSTQSRVPLANQPPAPPPLPEEQQAILFQQQQQCTDTVDEKEGDAGKPKRLTSTEWIPERTPPRPTSARNVVARPSRKRRPHSEATAEERETKKGKESNRKANKKFNFLKSFLPLPVTPERPGAAQAHFARGGVVEAASTLSSAPAIIETSLPVPTEYNMAPLPPSPAHADRLASTLQHRRSALPDELAGTYPRPRTTSLESRPACVPRPVSAIGSASVETPSPMPDVPIAGAMRMPVRVTPSSGSSTHEVESRAATPGAPPVARQLLNGTVFDDEEESEGGPTTGNVTAEAMPSFKRDSSLLSCATVIGSDASAGPRGKRQGQMEQQQLHEGEKREGAVMTDDEKVTGIVPSRFHRTSISRGAYDESGHAGEEEKQEGFTSATSEVRGASSSSNGCTERGCRPSISQGGLMTPTCGPSSSSCAGYHSASSPAAMQEWNDGAVDLSHISFTSSTASQTGEAPNALLDESALWALLAPSLRAEQHVLVGGAAAAETLLENLLTCAELTRMEMLQEYCANAVAGAIDLHQRMEMEQSRKASALPLPPNASAGRRAPAPRSPEALSGSAVLLAPSAPAHVFPSTVVAVDDDSNECEGTERQLSFTMRGAAKGITPLSVLFRAFCEQTEPHQAAELVETYFSAYMQHHTARMRHTAFDALYVHMVAIPALVELERHERYVVCMSRDLYIRKKIEEFMWTWPSAPPHAGVFGLLRGPFSVALGRPASGPYIGRRGPLQSISNTSMNSPSKKDRGLSYQKQRPCKVGRVQRSGGVNVSHNSTGSNSSGRWRINAHPRAVRANYGGLKSGAVTRGTPLHTGTQQTLPNIRKAVTVLRAKERVRSKPRQRTPPPTPTEDDFMNIASLKPR